MSRLPTRFGRAGWVTGIGLGCLLQPAIAAELAQPPICSAATAAQPDLVGICSVTPLGNGHNEVKISLTAASAEIAMGGYRVTTGNYNGNYLTPIVEAMPGDTLSAHLVNALTPNANGGGMHDHNDNPTNLHYFHGGIVSPNNARPAPAELGTGDNIYVYLKSGRSFDFKVPIPGEKPIPGNDVLDARVLESEGYIPHPLGLNWYHSHLHGISSSQVMGGMSGLLSVGEATANVKAGCLENPSGQKCLNDVAKDTNDLKRKTKVRYALLRDMPIMNITKLPEQANGDAAIWDPDPAARDFSPGTQCGVWKPDGSGPNPDPTLRTGFCQRKKDTALLFTVNGQRYPTITIEGDENLLLRLGNLSANIPYWLELRNETDGTILPITILGLDGVVPAIPIAPGQAQKPVQAVNYDDVLMMPAMRAEIYVRNDEKPHTTQQVYILKSKKHAVGMDEWPEIQLARIVLEPNAATSRVLVALNAAVATVPQVLSKILGAEKAVLPEGCVRDLDPTYHEYRRVTFLPGGLTSDNRTTDWSVYTEIVRPTGREPKDDFDQVPDNPKETTVAIGVEADGVGRGYPFEEYVRSDGLIDWTKRHVCIFIDNTTHAGSHKQLWVLFNATNTLHNFHIHQMKFRLATADELKTHFIAAPPSPRTCGQDACPADIPNYDLYDDQKSSGLDPGETRRWHDTIPLPPNGKVFVVMSFDATQQVGRFVFHCHILKHEDSGLMAPIEVWNSSTGLASQ